MEEETRIEKSSSIEVSRNAKGEFSFKVKLYYDTDTKNGDDIVNEVEKLIKDLKSRFLR